MSIPADLRDYQIPRRLLGKTWELLAAPGRDGYEASVLWTAQAVDARTARITGAWQPEQIAYKSDEGVAVEVTQAALTELILALPPGQFVAVRLHTHPADAYHSAVDDTNMIIGHTGAISIVVPSFAREPLDLLKCSVNELRPGRGWVELDATDVAARFQIL